MIHAASKHLACAAVLVMTGSVTALGQATIAAANFRTITIDGDFSDWHGIDPAVTIPSLGGGSTGTRVDIKAVWLAHDQDHLFVRFQLHAPLPAHDAVNLFLNAQPGLGGGFYQEGYPWYVRILGGTGYQTTTGDWSGPLLSELDFALSPGPSDDYELRISRRAHFASPLLPSENANPHYLEPVFQQPDALLLRLRGNTVDGTWSGSGPIAYDFSATAPDDPTQRHTFPAYEPAVFANPFKGFGPWAGFQPASPAIPFTLAKTAVTWLDLQPTTSAAYDWDALEDGWAPHLAAGRRVGFRFRMALPATDKFSADIPDWLIDLGVPIYPYEILEQTGLAPDWNHPALLDYHDAVIAALGERYDGDPRIAWVDIGSYGFWGEWHLYQNTTTLPQATDATKRRIIDAYIDAFPNTPLLIPFDDTAAAAYALQPERGVALRNDCLGTAPSAAHYLSSLADITAHSANTSGENLALTMPLRAPVSGEFCGAEAGGRDALDQRFLETLTFVEETRWSFLSGAGGQLITSTGERLERVRLLHRRMGYRLRIESARYPHTLRPDLPAEIRLALVNEGVAPFYRAWPIAVALLHPSDFTVAHTWTLSPDDADPRTWIEGRHVITATLGATGSEAPPVGDYLLALAILDPSTSLPGLRFANRDPLANGYQILGPVTLDDPQPSYPATYAAWVQRHHPDHADTWTDPTSPAHPAVDHLGDGLSQFHRYAFDLPPHSPATTSHILRPQAANTPDQPILLFTLPTPLPGDIHYELRYSADLEDWLTLDWSLFNVTPLHEHPHHEYSLPLSGLPPLYPPVERHFFRLHATPTNP